MAKDKKKKSGGKKGKGSSALDTFKSLGSNTLVADVVAAALVATAAALRDPNKARRFASEAGDQLEQMSKDGAEKGGAMWQLALDVGRRALDTMTSDKPAKSTRAKAAVAAKRKTPANRNAAAASSAPAKRKTAAKPRAVAKSKAAAKPKAAAKSKAPGKSKAAAKSKATAVKTAAAKPKARRAAKKKS